MRLARLLTLPLVLVASAAVLSYDSIAESPGERMSASAATFLSSLDDAQTKRIRFPYESAERVQWHFVPMDTRKGVPLKEMTEPQREATRQLLATALSESGYKKADSIMNLEKLLQELEGDGRRWPRDWLLYYVTIFGDPAGDSRWGLSFEGHHMSLNFVVEKGRVVSSTPQFFGANPAVVRTGGAGTEKGTAVLRDEEQLAADLLAHLSADQRRSAVISPVAAERLAAIDKAGFENVHFAWLGGDKPGEGHGYQVQGPTFLIELNNTQPDAEGNPANHIHSVYRDLRGDFALPID